MKGFAVCLFVLLGTTHGLINRYVYEFGQENGDILSLVEDHIPILHPVTEKHISVPPYSTVTYVRVTVDAISPPKVDFNADENLVTIMYSWTQISMSKYSILIKGIISS